MSHLYFYLSEGEDNDESVHLAKLKYLETTDNFTAHPFFWSGYVLIGDASVCKFRSESFLYPLLLILVLSLTAGILLKIAYYNYCCK